MSILFIYESISYVDVPLFLRTSYHRIHLTDMRQVLIPNMYRLPLCKYLATLIYPEGSQQPLIAAVVFLSTLLALAACSPLTALSPLPDAFFPGPFSTDGRWMTNAQGQRLTYAGVNWPGHGEAMVPEGLQYASIKELVTKIKGIGINTYDPCAPPGGKEVNEPLTGSA